MKLTPEQQKKADEKDNKEADEARAAVHRSEYDASDRTEKEAALRDAATKAEVFATVAAKAAKIAVDAARAGLPADTPAEVEAKEHAAAKLAERAADDNLRLTMDASEEAAAKKRASFDLTFPQTLHRDHKSLDVHDKEEKDRAIGDGWTSEVADEQKAARDAAGKVKATETEQAAAEKRAGSNPEFPKTLYRAGKSLIVHNKDEKDEAIRDGWQS